MGFVGASTEGITTTLGRGGTDLSASVLAQVLDAEGVHYLKEVDGIMSADPRLVPTAQRIDRLSYEEVAELSYFGAKVLHPVAVHPLREAGIPASIRDVHDFSSPGTLVGPAEADHDQGAKAITTIPDVCVVTVEGGGMQGIPGMAGRVFHATSREGVNVLMISQASSEQNISLVVPGVDGPRTRDLLEAEFELELLKGRVEGVGTLPRMAILSLVGDGMHGGPGIAGKLFSALGDGGINIALICQGSSERNVSFLVCHSQVQEALRRIHDRFRMGADGEGS
jgi:aspartate kinase